MQSVKTRTGEFYIDENGILHAVMFADVLIDYEDALDNFLVIKHLTKNQPSIRLIDVVNAPSFNSKARKFLRDKEVQNLTIARAVLTSSNLKKVSLNLFVRFNTGSTPAMFFTNYDEAIGWLKTFKK